MRNLFILAASAMLAACAAGPDYETPDIELPEQFTEAPAPGVSADSPTSIRNLWDSLGDDQLSDLIDTALIENTTIRQALATLNETRALSGLAVYSLFPTVNTTAEYERNTISQEDPFAFPGQDTVERYRAGFDAVWEIDFFGSLRRQAESFRYLVEADEASAHAVRLAIIAEVAQTYFRWQGEMIRLQVLEDNRDNQADSVAILEAGLDAGRNTAFDVARSRAVLAQISAALPTAEAAIKQSVQRLSALTGTPSKELFDRLSAPASLPMLPPLETVGTPVLWLARRPDIMAAERRLASATADIGVATAEYYPKVQLVGDFGWTGVESGAIGRSTAERSRFAPTISWRILDFGRVRQQAIAAEARADGAFAAFEETWLLALEETENALATYWAVTERLSRLDIAAGEAGEAARLAELRFSAGIDNYIQVLDAERTRIELEDLLAQAYIDRGTSLAALYKALGGDFAEALLPEAQLSGR